LQTAVFPIQGWSFKVEAGIGSRIWLRDAAISSIVWKNSEGFFENIFDSLQRTGNLRQTTLKLSYSAALHLPVVHSWVLYFSAQGEEYKAPVINFSELSRWGGINSIRGFNEQRIFASSFHMANFELRFMAGQSGFIAPFVSGAVYRNGTQLNMGYRSLYSLGLAGGLKTGAGIMKFAWAMGNEGLGFNLRDAKFHLGLSNVF
jgi:hemolysin activation/secretion protein